MNISTSFIENVIKAINQQEIKSSRMLSPKKNYNFLNKDQINSWILINRLGS